jgi:hypothetical protein
MNYTGAINPNAPVHNPSGGMARLTGPTGNAYAPYGAQEAFNDNYRSMGQRAAVDLDRANTESQNAYYNQAADIQNRGALQGLGMLGQQRDNAQRRQSAAEAMQYKWMNDMMQGSAGLLGGLL